MVSKFVKELGYDNFAELKESCSMYVGSLGLKDRYFQLDSDFRSNSSDLVVRMNNLLTKSFVFALIF